MASENLKTLEEAILLYNHTKHKEAFDAFMALVLKNPYDDESQYYLGLMYFNGHGVDKNKEEAHSWWKKSAKLRNQDAVFQLESVSMTRNTRF